MKKSSIVLMTIFVTLAMMLLNIYTHNSEYVTNLRNGSFKTKTPEGYEYVESEPENIPLPTLRDQDSIYYEMNKFIIVFDLDLFKSYINARKENYDNNLPKPSSIHYDRMKDINYFYSLLNDSRTEDIKLESQNLAVSQQNIIEDKVLDYIKSSNISIFDKSSDSYIDYVQKVNYHTICEGLCGSTGVKYKSPSGEEIIQELISIS